MEHIVVLLLDRLVVGAALVLGDRVAAGGALGEIGEVGAGGEVAALERPEFPDRARIPLLVPLRPLGAQAVLLGQLAGQDLGEVVRGQVVAAVGQRVVAHRGTVQHGEDAQQRLAGRVQLRDHVVQFAGGRLDLLLTAGEELGQDVEQAVLPPYLDALPVLVQRLVHPAVIILAAFLQMGAGRPDRGRHQLLEARDVAEPERVDHSRANPGLPEGVGKTIHPRLVRQPADRHPFHDSGLAERVRVHALDEEHRLGDIREEHRRLLAGDAEQHLVGEPLDHRVQVAQVSDVRPQGLGLPGLVQLALGQLAVEGHLHPLGDVVLLQVGRRQHHEPLHQVLRRLEGEHLAVVADVQRGAGEAQGLTGERLGRGEQLGHVGVRRLGAAWLVTDPGEQVGEEVIDRVRRLDRLIHRFPAKKVLTKVFLLRAVNRG